MLQFTKLDKFCRQEFIFLVLMSFNDGDLLLKEECACRGNSFSPLSDVSIFVPALCP